MMKRRAMLISALATLGLAVLMPGRGAWATELGTMLENCANCHGKDGASRESDVPIIGGVSATFLADSLTAYKQKERPCPETKYLEGSKKGQKTDMCQIAKDLSDAEIKQLAEALAGKKFVRAQQTFDAALAAKGKSYHDNHCEKCHSEGGSLASDDAGILAGQWIPYLRETFEEYKSGKRPMEEKMKPKMDKVDKAAIEALVNYYGSFK